MTSVGSLQEATSLLEEDGSGVGKGTPSPPAYESPARRTSMDTMPPELVKQNSDFSSMEGNPQPSDAADWPLQLVSSRNTRLQETYWHFQSRLWHRLRLATYGKEKSLSVSWILFMLLCYGGYLTIQIAVFHRWLTYFEEFIVMGFISVCIGLLAGKVSWILRVILLECYAFFLTFFIGDFYNKPDLYLPAGGILVGTALVTWLAVAIYPALVTCFVGCTGKDVTVFVSDGTPYEKYKEEDVHRYTFHRSLCCARCRTAKSARCVYEGKLRNGSAHGLGTWTDNSYRGEHLTGYFNNGIPVGPFESAENDTRNILANLRIVVATDAGGTTWLERKPLSYGVAAVESCVSGEFIQGYPRVSMTKAATRCTHNASSKCTCLAEIVNTKEYRHIDHFKKMKSVTISVDEKRNTLLVSGHRSSTQRQHEVHVTMTSVMQEGPRAKARISELSFDGNWSKNTGSEGIVYIHGLNHSLDDSIKRFGQFLALGHLPPHIRPFIFNWPASNNGALYWCAHNVASDNDVHRDLRRFFNSLAEAGITELHVMCHSMGCRFFMRAFSTVRDTLSLKVGDVFRTTTSTTTVAMSPGDHLIGNSHARYGAVDVEGRIQLVNLILLNPDYELHTFINDYDQLSRYIGQITVYADDRDEAIQIAIRCTTKPSLGSNTEPLYDNEGTMLDVDVIDTGDLDQNMSSSRHGYFNVNRMMVDDLTELVVTRKRAEERFTHLRRYRNVYRFSHVPLSVQVV